MRSLGIEFVTIEEYEVGVLHEDGRFVRVLGPGRYRLTGRPWSGNQRVDKVDRRRQMIAIQGQEVLTADGLPVRLNLSAEYRVADAVKALHSVASYVASLYRALQIALRDAVQARPIDTLLAERSALGAELETRVAEDAREFGVEVVSVGVKDIILPADVRKMLAREAEALRTGRAALVAAREEVATLRARANAAKIFAENPHLQRLSELEAMTKIAEGAGNTVVMALPTRAS